MAEVAGGRGEEMVQRARGVSGQIRERFRAEYRHWGNEEN